jgi:hypothetical protein
MKQFHNHLEGHRDVKQDIYITIFVNLGFPHNWRQLLET